MSSKGASSSKAASSSAAAAAAAAASKPQKEKPKIMSASGQTEQFRRGLRAKQRTLYKEVIDEGQDIEDSTKPAFANKLSAANEIFKDVAYVREAVLDGEILSSIAIRASKQVRTRESAQRDNT